MHKCMLSYTSERGLSCIRKSFHLHQTGGYHAYESAFLYIRPGGIMHKKMLSYTSDRRLSCISVCFPIHQNGVYAIKVCTLLCNKVCILFSEIHDFMIPDFII